MDGSLALTGPARSTRCAWSTRTGRIAEGRRFRQDEAGLRALCARLVRLQVRLVALERPDGLLIERLLDASLPVVAVHPNQVKPSQPRYSVAGGKSDVFDSFVLAELARTDSHRFRVLVPDSDRTKALRAATRAREIGLANQLRDQLGCFWPGATKVFWPVDSAITLAFLRRYPSPIDARGLGEQRLAAFLTRHGYTGRKPARELLGRLRSGAEGRADVLEMAARRQIVLALVSALEPIVARISELTIEIRHAIEAHPDGLTFRSLVDQNSWLCAATMLAEIGDCRERYPNYRALAADAGQAPVAVESGKSKQAKFRWACDHRLRDAFDTLSDASRRHNPWATDIYDRARARGASNAHAARILGRASCKIIWRLWHDHDTYDPARHTARQRLISSRAA